MRDVLINPDDLAGRTAPQACQTMEEVRDGVDRLDRALIALIAERTRYMDAAARIKPSRGVVRDEARIEDVITKVKAAARTAGVPESLAEPVWRELVERSIQHELTVWDATREPQRKVR
ncbi:MAG: chorismate mutase [Oceanicaulis sp.]|uniref:chorismate mutase n=1 Tax=Glycocaulis sp. TaxID=1969725 RepID=UPI0025C472E4|nr:chorismate mutase [Glycocaulis sp.]MCC5982441.1 chorismate mutase [Oceanicaulis sp.]MCH8520453.1 chorismate mutase [Glycocaulis sp.]